MNFATAELCDQYREKLSVMPPVFQAFGGINQCCGRVRTLKISQDNSAFWEMLRDDGLQHILVVDAGAEVFAVMGDQMGRLAVENNWAGVIINGYLRDAAILSTLPIGIWALGKYPMKGRRIQQGLKDTGIRLYDTLIEPGNFVYADNDGILFTTQALV